MSSVSLIDGHIDYPRMTDNEIIKALECCSDTDCDNCPFEEQCRRNGSLSDIALDLINRQKAEIERLKDEVQKQKEKTNDVIRSYVENEWC